MEDTITLEPEVLAIDEGGQSEEVETPLEVNAEEADGEESVETEVPTSAFEDEDSARKDPTVASLIEKVTKDVSARLTKSFTDKEAYAKEQAEKAAREQVWAQQSSEASRWRQGEAARGLSDIVKYVVAQANEGKTEQEVFQASWNALNGIAQRMEQAAHVQTFQSATDIANEVLTEAFPGYSAPNNLVEPYFGAAHRGDFRAAFKALAKIAADAADKDPTRAERIEKEVRAKAQNESKLSATRQAAATRQGMSPTTDMTPGGQGRWTRARFEKEYGDTPSKWISLPKDERNKIMAEVEQDDLRTSRR